MSDAGQILDVRPKYALPGGEIEVVCKVFRPERGQQFACLLDGRACRITAASSTRVMAVVPSTFRERTTAALQLSVGDGDSETRSAPAELRIGGVLAEDMHIVANPAIDPSDDAIVVTRSGSRGQRLENTIYRVETSGFIDELPEPILNPTGMAFGPDGRLYVTNRAAGEVWVVSISGNHTVRTTGLGIATGIAFDEEGVMYVGDRSGTIFRIKGFNEPQTFANLEPSVAAYHIAFGPEGKLFVTAPGLASSDAIHVIDRKGDVTTYFRGLGRPQGLAFDTDGNLYAAACYKGRHGIVRISPGAEHVEQFVAGNSIVGLCFTRDGDMIIATNDSVYSLPVGIQGTLLQ